MPNRPPTAPATAPRNRMNLIPRRRHGIMSTAGHRHSKSYPDHHVRSYPDSSFDLLGLRQQGRAV